MKIRVLSIEYETDGIKIDLPKTIEFKVDKDFNVDNELADLISNKTGWLVKSFDYEMI